MRLSSATGVESDRAFGRRIGSLLSTPRLRASRYEPRVSGQWGGRYQGVVYAPERGPQRKGRRPPSLTRVSLRRARASRRPGRTAARPSLCGSSPRARPRFRYVNASRSDPPLVGEAPLLSSLGNPGTGTSSPTRSVRTRCVSLGITTARDTRTHTQSQVWTISRGLTLHAVTRGDLAEIDNPDMLATDENEQRSRAERCQPVHGYGRRD